jgi:disulfide bond formation protein DsbB
MKGKATTVCKSLGWLALWLGLLGLLAVPALNPRADDDDRHGSLSPGLAGLGYGALAVGVPLDNVDATDSAGAVNVLYSSMAGLGFADNQWWHQDSYNIEGAAEFNDRFGWALATGDFDGDGYRDLAVGVPQEGIEVEMAGAVNVLYGRDTGLSFVGSQLWHQDSAGILGEAEEYDQFGWALAAGDFDGDGYSDLAVGVPGEGVGEVSNAGAVHVLYGSAAGLSAIDNQLWHQGSTGMADAPEGGDGFGIALAASDLNGDGFSDLAVGVSGEDVEAVSDAGAVHILYGTGAGLSAIDNQFWHQDSTDVGGVAEEEDYFGRALAAGDLNGDGYGDLAVGVFGEDVGSVPNAGAVNVLYGSTEGLIITGNQLWHQNSAGIVGTAAISDRFGWSVAAGDLDGDGYGDLAVGVFGDSAGVWGAGAVNVLYGSAAGLSDAGNQLWHQNSPGIEDAAESEDRFGAAVAVGDLNGDGYGDLAVGVPGESVETLSNAGAVNVLYGSAEGLSAAGNQVWHQESAGIRGISEEGDEFGAALAILDRPTTERLYLPLVVRGH